MNIRHHYQLWSAAIILALLCPAAIAQAAQPVGPQVSSKMVVAAIRKGVHYLLSRNKSGTHWEQGVVNGGLNGKLIPQYLGESALVTEALLDVQQSLHLPELNIFKDPMKSAVNFLVNHRNSTTYVASFQAAVMGLLPKKTQYRKVLEWDADYLLRSLNRDGSYGYIIYPTPVRAGRNDPFGGDNSNTQYGILGMWTAADYGLSVPEKYWMIAANYWRRTQQPDGTWWYTPDRIEPVQMTPAGVASLLICDEYLARRDTSRRFRDPSVELGLKWIDAHFQPQLSELYTMYGYERVGLASGLQRFGGHNWYGDFARTLLQHQQVNGSWVTTFWPNQHYCLGTAYALLILDRGLNPVLCNKLQYTKPYFGDWNARQRDVANMVEWISKQTEAPLNWQVANIHAPLGDWLNSPILYISGQKDPKFTPQQIAKLRRYVDAGGLVLCSCNNSSVAFQRAMIKYGREVVNKQYEFQRLTNKSVLFNMQPWFHMYMNVLALSNGSRYLWLVCPGDLGAIWERQAVSQRSFWEFPLNLYLYATGKGSLADRLHSTAVPAAAKPPARTVKIGLVKYPGNWNPEPGAWPRLTKLLATDAGTGAILSTVNISAAGAADVPLLHLTGTDALHFSDQDVAALRQYVQKGGLLFADGTGGNPEFANGFTQLMMKAFPDKPLQKIPDDAPFITGKVPGGVDASKVTYRRFFVSTKGVRSKPGLLGIKIGKRWGVIFSQTDITSGLLGTNTWGILGYSPKSSVALARNIVEYACQSRK